MNTTLKFDPHGRLHGQIEQSDLRAYYDRTVRAALLSLWRHKQLIANFVVAGLVLAALAIPLMPRKYSAEALLYSNVFLRDRGTARAQTLAGVDAASLINSEVRLIRSDAILRAVVKRLGLDHDSTASSWTSWSTDWITAWLFPEKRKYSSLDRAVATLRDKVDVVNDMRSYLVSISYTTSSAEQAARVVNSFVIEFLRDKAIQHRMDTVNAAEAELDRQLAVYDDKHPKVLQAADALEAARDALKAAMSPQDEGQDNLATEEGVKLAVPDRTPTSPKGFVILGLSFLVSLLSGSALAIWRDRRDAKHKHVVCHEIAK
jgi:uncharacterized protein involved in exopolysaccharide biosynthesis